MNSFAKFADAFVRNPDGSWFCRAAKHIVGPNGPLTITPGVSYRAGRPVNGYDIGQMLTDWHYHRVEPLHIQVL